MFRGNILYDNNRVAAGEGEIWVQYGSGNVVENNLVVAGGSAGENLAIASFAGSSGNTFDYNLYDTLDGSPAVFQRNGAVYAGLAAWQAGSGQDGSSISTDPLLTDPEGGDFHLTVASPAIGADELTCGDGTVNVGEECEDDNLVAGDCCSTSCAYEAPGSACDDGATCSIVDACDGAGECLGDAAADPACESAGPGGASLKMRAGAKAALSWRWGRGGAGDLADLGAPPGGRALAVASNTRTVSDTPTGCARPS